MKATGIVRRIDDLGRVVIPKEIRRTLRLREGTPLEIFTDREGEIILKKYSPMVELAAFAVQYAEAMAQSTGLMVCIADRDQIIAVSGGPKKEYYQKTISRALELGILFIPSFARIVRSEVIRCRELDFVKSARILGAGHIRIIFAHILPNAAVSLLTAAAIGFNNAVLAEASMSYLGLGIQPPEPSLGRMLYEAQSYLFNAPWYAIGPGVTIILIILGFSMVSEGLRSMQQ